MNLVLHLPSLSGSPLQSPSIVNHIISIPGIMLSAILIAQLHVHNINPPLHVSCFLNINQVHVIENKPSLQSLSFMLPLLATECGKCS